MMKAKPSKDVNRGVLLTVIMISSFFNPFMGSAVNVALPSISKDLSMNAVALSWIAMSFLLSSAILMVPLGKLADILGRKKMMLWGNIFFVIATLLCAVSKTGSMLIFARFLQGIGSAMMLSSSMAIVISAFPPEIRGRIIGLNSMAVYVGLSAAPLLGGFLTEYVSWQSIFYINAFAGLLVIAGILYGVRTEWAEAKTDRFDFKGSIVYIISMTALMYGFSRLPGAHAIILTVAGLIGMVVFVYMEMKVKFPILNIKLFANNKIFAFSNLSALINYAATFGITFIMSLYLQNARELSPGDAGMLLITQPLVMAITSSISGRLSDRIDSRILASVGMAITVIGLLFLIFLKIESSNLYIVISLFILGLGFGMFSSPNTNAVMSSVTKKYLGIASATISTMRLTGQMFSMAIAALAIHLFVGEEQINHVNATAFMHSVKLAFSVFAILCFLGIFASLARGKRDQIHEL